MKIVLKNAHYHLLLTCKIYIKQKYHILAFEMDMKKMFAKLQLHN